MSMQRKILRKAFAFVSVLLAGFLLVSAAPSLDGRALVAEDGVFPKGYFAKTVGYLPGDIISVTNPANGERLDILVIGALDPAEGVAILLSPEAAGVLSIRRGANAIVKLTRRAGDADTVAAGSAVITSDPPRTVTTAPVADERAPIVLPPPVVDAPIVEDKPVLVDVPTRDDLSLAYDFEDIPEESVQENAPAVAYPPISEDVLAARPPAQSALPERTPAAPIAEDDLPALAAEKVFPDALPDRTVTYTWLPLERVFVDDFAEKRGDVSGGEQVWPDIFKETLPLRDYGEIVADDGLFDDRRSPTPISDTERVALDGFDEAAPSRPLDGEKVAIDDLFGGSGSGAGRVEAELVYADPIADRKTLPEYDAIVLVPAGEKPPVSERADWEDELDYTSGKDYYAVPDLPDFDYAPSASGDVTYLKRISELAPSRYYVQIGVYKQKAYVDEVSSQYAASYPITVVDAGSRQTVLVGPLRPDEYGVVLERFKSYGFKDAFARKTL